EAKAASNVLMNEFARSGVDPAAVDGAQLAKLLEARSRIPRDTFAEALAASGDPGFDADRYLGDGLVADPSELEPLVEGLLAANPSQVESYRRGKHGLFGFFLRPVIPHS